MHIWKVHGLNSNLEKLLGKIAILLNSTMLSHMFKYHTWNIAKRP